jgi:Uma2 family endonuclease
MASPGKTSAPQDSDSPGPFRTSHLSPGDRYELRRGHPIYCAPTGGDGSRGTACGAQVLDTDPAVTEMGIEPGFTMGPGELRAPDIAVGNVPDKPGWIQGVPPLAIEYASVGQDEKELESKIADLLKAGTQFIWVVRLLGPRRVEVHTRGEPMRLFRPGEELRAPGILQNAVPVEALFDRNAAHEATLRNLLQRKGYESLEAVREAGREKGILEGQLATVTPLLEQRLGRALTQAEHARLAQRLKDEGPGPITSALLNEPAEELNRWLASKAPA